MVASGDTSADGRPRLFIGSAAESLEVAYALQESLERDARVQVWSQGLFKLTKPGLTSLVEALDTFDFAAFVFTPDDVVVMRGEEQSVTRDNVVFELGLFLGRLGPHRSFVVAPRGTDLHLPTDLLGITTATYDPADEDHGDFQGALGPAANRIRRAIRQSRNDALSAATESSPAAVRTEPEGASASREPPTLSSRVIETGWSYAAAQGWLPHAAVGEVEVGEWVVHRRYGLGQVAGYHQSRDAHALTIDFGGVFAVLVMEADPLFVLPRQPVVRPPEERT